MAFLFIVHERWDTHDAQLAETRIGADDNGQDVILPMYDYALTYSSVGDLADQLEAIADAEERLAPPVMMFSFIEERLPMPLENRPGSVMCDLTEALVLLLPTSLLLLSSTRLRAELSGFFSFSGSPL